MTEAPTCYGKDVSEGNKPHQPTTMEPTDDQPLGSDQYRCPRCQVIIDV